MTARPTDRAPDRVCADCGGVGRVGVGQLYLRCGYCHGTGMVRRPAVDR